MKARRSGVALSLVSIAAAGLMAWPLLSGKPRWPRRPGTARRVAQAKPDRLDDFTALAFTPDDDRVVAVDGEWQWIASWNARELAAGHASRLHAVRAHRPGARSESYSSWDEVYVAAFSEDTRH